MFVCRNLDYIVNGELHKSLDEKLTIARRSGVEITIELVEPIDDIIIDAKELIKMTNQIIDDALAILKETDDKKMIFCSFYHNNALWVIIKYNGVMAFPPYSMNEKLNKILNNHLNIISNMTYENPWLTQELIIYKK